MGEVENDHRAGLDDPGVQGGGRIDHPDSVFKENAGLVAHCSRGIALRRGFTIGTEHVKTNAGRERRFAVALADFDVSVAKAAETVRGLPAEERSDDELLPGLE